MSIKQNAEFIRALGGPGSGRHKEGAWISSKVLRGQKKREAATASHLAKLATDKADAEDTISAHRAAFNAHDEAAGITQDADYDDLAKFHAEKANQHLDRIIQLRKKK